MRPRFQEAIIEGIGDSDTKGYDWEIRSHGVWWAYADTTFRFTRNKTDQCVTVYTEWGKPFIRVWFGDSLLAGNVAGPSEAFYIATRQMINLANQLFIEWANAHRKDRRYESKT